MDTASILIVFGLVLLFLTVITFFIVRKSRKSKQLAYIQSYKFPNKVTNRLQEVYPHLSDEDVKKVLRALRDYFHICHEAKNKMVSMPSQVVDVAWHEFILFTREYQSFCSHALGRFLHHTPSEAMKSPTIAQDGIKRAWRIACAKEKIDPNTPSRLPLIFAIDAQLNIQDGFKYALNCQNKNSRAYGDGYCASHIGCASGCAGDSAVDSHNSDSGGGWFDSDSSSCGGGGD